MKPGDWCAFPERGTVCRIVDIQTLWEEAVCRVWLPDRDIVMRVPAARLRPIHEAKIASSDQLAYVAAATRIGEALAQDVLLAPVVSSVIPLPHQIRALARAMAGDRVRYLLADEVGLGKTIEAGLIMRELKLRGLVQRTLVIAPKGLVRQWVAEMRTHFGEEFRLVIPGELGFPRDDSPDDNIWRRNAQVVCPMDAVKPLSSRRGWSKERLDAYNRQRFEDLIAAGWDLVIVDEAHRLGGGTEQVARYKLGRALAEAAPYLLLLSATPHQGKSDHFRRLMSLLDPDAFPDEESISRERVRPYVIRTEKRRAVDLDGKPLFQPRRTELAPVAWQAHHRAQQALYEAVTEYVREGYNQAMREKRRHIGFLMILMQRLVASSTRAVRATLERRLEVLGTPEEPLPLFPELGEEDWAELDGEEQVETLMRTRALARKNERAEVRRLLELARRCEAQGPDAKAEALLEWIYRLQAEEGDPDLKVLVFTEFVATQDMLCEFLEARGFRAARLNGSMSMEERMLAQQAFAKDARILVSTDAGGEGLNLQFCHVVINYDIPWNPMRLEQRIGRVDRIGQTRPVRAINLVLEDSVEHRVLEVLEEKLAVIFAELGIDKAGDVLDSAQAERMFDELYVEAILHPDEVDARVEALAEDVREQARRMQEQLALLGVDDHLDPHEARRLRAHPLPHWVERMTVSYLRAHGGAAERRNGAWNLTWPDGTQQCRVVFTNQEAQQDPTCHHLTLEDSRVRALMEHVPMFAPGQPIPVVALPGLATDITGFWSLWRITLAAADWRRARFMPLFLSDNGQVFAPTARYIWEELVLRRPAILRHMDPETSRRAFAHARRLAEQEGRAIYEDLLAAHRQRLERERARKRHMLAVQRRLAERIGLSQVRRHRLEQLEQERQRFEEEMKRRAHILPEITPLLMLRVEGTP